MIPPTEDLWPTFQAPNQLRAPKKILIEQASLLADKTGNLVRGEVVPLKRKDFKGLIFGMNLVAPALNFYRLRLLFIEHSTTKLYPVLITFNIGDRVEAGFPDERKADDEKSFLICLRELLSSEATLAAVSALMAQSDGLPVPEEEVDDIPF